MIKKNIYNLRDAIDFTNDFGADNDLAKVLNYFRDFKDSLKIFVNKGDEANFRKLTDKYSGLIKSLEGKSIRRDAYYIFDGLCSEINSKKIENLAKIEAVHNIKDYSQEDVYRKIDSFLNGLSQRYVKRYSKLTTIPIGRWNNKKDTMYFRFKYDGSSVKGNIKLREENLIFKGNIPVAAILHINEIEEKIEKRLEKVFPKK